MNTTESTATPTNANAGAHAASVAPGTVTAKKAATRRKSAPKAKNGANKAKPKKTCNAPKKAASKSEPREGSKKQAVIEMLGRNGGATMAEIAKETGITASAGSLASSVRNSA